MGGAGQAWRKPIHRPGRGVISHSTVKFARKVKVVSPNVDRVDVLPITLLSIHRTLHVEVALQSISWQGGQGKSWCFLQKRHTVTRNRWVLAADLRFFSRESHASSEKIENAPWRVKPG